MIMKKCVSMLLIMCMFCLLAAGCSKGGGSPSSGNNTNAKEGAAPAGGTAGENSEPSKKTTVDGAADVDLTVLSSTMVFAEVNNIVTKPAGYMGKTIKMSGAYTSEYWDETDKEYHYVIISDATGCCPQGLEFIWNGKHSYPGDYPEKLSNIEIIGVFDSYDELGQTYYYLAVDDISIK